MRSNYGIQILKLAVGAAACAIAQAGEIHDAVNARDVPKVRQLLADRPALVDERLRDGATALHLAAAMGAKETVELLLNSGANINAEVTGSGNVIGEWYFRFSPLHCAVLGGYREVAELLLAHKADVNRKAIRHLTPLHLAIIPTDKEMVKRLLGRAYPCVGHQFQPAGNKEMVELLLARKADVTAVADSDWGMPLHVAALAGQTDIVKLLLAHKADVNGLSAAPYYSTPLHEAARTGRKDVVELLLNHKADFNSVNRGGSTPLHVAGGAGHMAVVEMLLDCYTANAATNINNWAIPLRQAVMTGKKEVVQLVLARGARTNVNAGSLTDEGTALHKAAYYDHYDIVELLLENKADVNAGDSSGETSLHVAAAKGLESMVELMLAHKGNVNARTKHGSTPLREAAIMGRKRVTELLLAHGADIGARDKYGSTPLHLASSYANKEVAEVLLSHKAEVNAKNSRGETPLDTAGERNRTEMVELLRRYGGRSGKEQHR